MTSRRTRVVVVGAAVAALVILVVLGGIAIRNNAGHGSDQGGGNHPAIKTPVPRCQPTATRPGPKLDLGVQASTGPRHPLLTAARVRELVAKAKQAGAHIISTQVSFSAVHPTRDGGYRFTGLDRTLDAARASGLQVRIRLIDMPDWALDKPIGVPHQPPRSGTEFRYWRQFVADVMTHVHGRVSYVEVWTEPNSKTYWPPGPAAAEYAKLVSKTAEVVRRIAPDVKIITGGLDGNDVDFLNAFYTALGDRRPFDLIGVAPWTNAAPTAVDHNNVRNSYPGLTLLPKVMAADGDPKRPLYVTAFGYPTSGNHAVSDSTRAEFATQALEIATCMAPIQGFSWYYLHPTPWDPPAWTLLDRNLNGGLTYNALVKWNRSTR